MMKFRGYKALRVQFPKGSIVQVRMLTERDNWIEVEGPVSEDEAKEILRLAIGPTPLNGEDPRDG